MLRFYFRLSFVAKRHLGRVCCSVLQYTAVCVAVCCTPFPTLFCRNDIWALSSGVLQCVAACCSACCSVLHPISNSLSSQNDIWALSSGVLQCIVACCSVCCSVCCNMLQYVAVTFRPSRWVDILKSRFALFSSVRSLLYLLHNITLER